MRKPIGKKESHISAPHWARCNQLKERGGERHANEKGESRLKDIKEMGRIKEFRMIFLNLFGLCNPWNISSDLEIYFELYNLQLIIWNIFKKICFKLCNSKIILNLKILN